MTKSSPIFLLTIGFYGIKLAQFHVTARVRSGSAKQTPKCVSNFLLLLQRVVVSSEQELLMGDKTSKCSGRNLQKVVQWDQKLMQATVKIIKSSPIGRLNRGFGNTDCILPAWFCTVPSLPLYCNACPLGGILKNFLGRYVPSRFSKLGSPELIFLAWNWGLWNKFLTKLSLRSWNLAKIRENWAWKCKIFRKIEVESPGWGLWIWKRAWNGGFPELKNCQKKGVLRAAHPHTREGW